MAILICDALAYYYLRNPLPFDMPSPKPLIPPPWKLEIVASDISYASLRAGQEGQYTEQQMEPVDYTCRLRYFEKIRRKIRDQAAAEGTGSVRLPQPEDGIFAAAQRHHSVPQRDDLFRRSRAEAADRKVLALLESRRIPLRWSRGESCSGCTQKFRMVHENNGTAYQRSEATP